MATLAVSRSTAQRSRWRGEHIHRALLALVAAAIMGPIVYLALRGISYYTMSLEERPFSPLHPYLRSSGTVGLKLGMFSLAMFGVLFLYPLRKRWRWLASIGGTRRWLNFHILFGITTPVVVTFHTAFKYQGVAGLAYWTMICVALSGFVGRYLYARIPRSLSAVKLTMEELESQTAALALQIRGQELFRAADLAPLLSVPAVSEIRRMGLVRGLWIMLRADVRRPRLVARLRRRVLRGTQRIATIGGLLASPNQTVESIVANIRRQSRLLLAMTFLDRTERIFHLWHIVHRPFSISFVALILIHIGVALSVGF